MTASEFNEVVDVHLRSFPAFFLSQLGPQFLRCLYREVLKDPSGISFVYRDGGTVQGFAVGTSQPRGLYGRLLRKSWHRFALASIVPVLRDPRIVPRLMNAFGKRDEEPPDQSCGLLMSIAVDPRIQANGIGVALVQAFLAECRCRGLSSVHLTTDCFENNRVNRFYQKLGFTIARTITTRQGREMNEYRIALSRTPVHEIVASAPALHHN